MIYSTCGLRVVVTVAALSLIVSAIDVQILPNVSELTLTSGGDFTINCTGDVPVEWNSDSVQYKNKSSSINISQGLINNTYISQLSLSRASYLDTGNYYCYPFSNDSNIQEQNSKTIYLFVEHNLHLLAVHSESPPIVKNENGNVVLPCRPTSPNVNVTLIKDEEEIIENVDYDPKIGFTLRKPTVRDSGIFDCEANRNNISEIISFSVHINPEVHKVDKPNINSNVAQSDHIIVGQNISLNCSVSVDLGVSYNLEWKVPDDEKIKTGHVQISNIEFFKSWKRGVGSILLNIQNVSTEDDGIYVCKLTVHPGKKNQAEYNLKTFTSDMTYLNLTVRGGIYEIIRKTGHRHVQWIIEVSAYPPSPTLTWKDPNGNVLGMNTEKINVENGKSTSKLEIKDLDLADSGVYELVADNGAHTKQIAVKLLVEHPPIVELNKSTIKEFYDVGKVHSVDCLIAGYPLPKVEWAFKKCPNYPECEKSYNKIPSNTYIEIQHTETLLISTVNINATESGMLLCYASNEFGNVSYESSFLVTDVSNALNIKGPPVAVEGDNITIECGASKYNYSQDIKWIYRTSNNIESPINNGEKIFINNNKTQLSYHSYLNLQNITHKRNGEYFCIVAELKTQNEVNKSYTLTVKDSHIPVIIKPSNSSSNSTKVKTGKTVKWNCYVLGLPTPTISWFKNGQPLRLVKNDTRVLLLDKNQTLLIRFTALEDEGSYICNASNRLGSDSLTNTLTLTDKPIEHEHFGFIAFCSVLIILLGILMIGCATHLKKEQKLKKELALAGLLHFENGAVESWNPDLGIEEQAELLPYDKRWEFPRDKLKLGKLIGSGAFGVVFKAEAIGIIDKDTTTTVAVKMVKPNADPSYIKALAAELKIMIHLGKSLNVVNLLGAYTGNINKRELMVIVEYCRFGNLHQYLLKQRDYFVDQVTPDGCIDFNIKTISKNPYYVNVPNKDISSEKYDDSGSKIGSDGYLVPDEVEPDWRSNYQGDYKNLILKPSCTNDLICWSFQVARGMEYLASRKILHGDLATRNVLLAEENIVKICDFGFAKTMYNSENYQKKSDKDLLPVKWMAIESLRDRVFSTQSDVWAFGIVLWEIFSLAVTPYPNIQKFNDLYSKLVEGYRMEQPKYANSEIYNVMLDCWKMNPMTRPSFTELADRLGNLLQDGTKSHYMNLNEVYMRMNSEESPSTDYLSLLTAPTYLNCSGISEHNSNSCPNISEHSDSKDEIEMRPMLHNPVECCGYINLTKPSSFSNPNYDVVDKSKNYTYLQSPCPSYV